AGIEEDRIARLDVALLHILLLQGGAHIGEADLLPGLHHRALEPGKVDQMPAGEERVQLFRAELLQAVSIAGPGRGEAVIKMHLALVAIFAELDTDMAERVELRPGLPDLRRQKLVVIDKLVLAKRAAGRPAGDAQREGARAEQRHAGFINPAELVDL